MLFQMFLTMLRWRSCNIWGKASPSRLVVLHWSLYFGYWLSKWYENSHYTSCSVLHYLDKIIMMIITTAITSLALNMFNQWQISIFPPRHRHKDWGVPSPSHLVITLIQSQLLTSDKREVDSASTTVAMEKFSVWGMNLNCFIWFVVQSLASLCCVLCCILTQQSTQLHFLGLWFNLFIYLFFYCKAQKIKNSKSENCTVCKT